MLILMLALLSGCTTLQVTEEEEEVLGRLESMEIRRTEEGSAPPSLVAMANAWGPLGIFLGSQLGGFPLGGTGNFYLAERLRGKDADTQWWLGLINSCTWPVSPLWSVPQVINDSRVVNQKDTAFYFTSTLRGGNDLGKRRALQLRAPFAFPPVKEQSKPDTEKETGVTPSGEKK